MAEAGVIVDDHDAGEAIGHGARVWESESPAPIPQLWDQRPGAGLRAAKRATRTATPITTSAATA